MKYSKKIIQKAKSKVSRHVHPITEFTDARGVQWVAVFKEKRKKWVAGKGSPRETIVINDVVYKRKELNND